MKRQNIVGYEPKIVSKIDCESRKSRAPTNVVTETVEATELMWSIFSVKTDISVVAPVGVGVEKRFTGKTDCNYCEINASRASAMSLSIMVGSIFLRTSSVYFPSTKLRCDVDLGGVEAATGVLAEAKDVAAVWVAKIPGDRGRIRKICGKRS